MRRRLSLKSRGWSGDLSLRNPAVVSAVVETAATLFLDEDEPWDDRFFFFLSGLLKGGRLFAPNASLKNVSFSKK